MARHRLLVGSSAAARRERGRDWLIERASRSPFLVVSSQQESADHFVRELALTQGSLFGCVRTTLDGLAFRLAASAMARVATASHSRLGQEALMARVVHEAGREGRLGPFENVAAGPGLVRALTTTLLECRHHEISSPSLEMLGGTGEYLAHLLSRYEQQSLERGIADRARVLALASDAARGIDRPTLLLDVPIHSPLEAALIEAIAEHAPILATVPEGDTRSLERLAEALRVSPERISLHEGTSSAIRDLQRFVFSGEAPPSREATSHVVILSAPGEAQEAVEIARAIHAEASQGTSFDTMAVLLRSPEAYTPHLEEAFRRASIPGYFENGTLRPDPSGRAFLSLLDCAAEELAATRFAEYLSLSQLPQVTAEGEPVSEPEEDILWAPARHALAPQPRDREPVQLELFAEPEKIDEPEKAPVIAGRVRAPWRWEKLLVDAAVIGGLDRWERRLAGLGRELEIRIAELADDASAEADSLRREREDLDHLKRCALPLIERLAELPQSSAWGGWLDALEGLAVKSLSHPDGVVSLLQELRPMSAVGPVGLFEVREVLAERLTLLSQQPAGYRYGKVWVAPVESARGMRFEVVLVPGLAERMFPRKIMEDPLLLDSARSKLDRALPVQKDRIENERLALRIAIGAATRKIVFSYPSLDLGKGRAKVPSFYLLEVARASQGRLPDFETLEREAASTSGARLGWPAPRDRTKAVDTTEFDLAFLADSSSKKPGAGRYLIRESPTLARSLRARFQRGRGGRFTPVDGFLEPSPAAKSQLREHRLGARAYSVTSLEKYAACPYRFYLNAIVRLRPRETAESVTHLDALTRGRILHDAQFYVLERLAETRQLPVTAEGLDDVLRTFEAVFDEVTERFYEELAPAIDRIWQDEIERIRFDLRGWLRREAESSQGFVPHRREFTFGMRPQGPADPTSTLQVAVLPNGLRLRGAIDLVEKRSDGKVRVTDHKSGKVWMPENAILNGGESLQPILYSLAYEALTGEDVESARLYYCTVRGGYSERVVRPDEEALDVVAEFQRRLDEIIEEGFFPANPKPPLGCRFCDYLPVCGPRMEIDAKRKENDPRLSPLNWLRNLT
ncbi:MAG TPA: PD-(D/E)XK nuclease family protein [Vicinamibacteria bacterium]|nr:PD-(D/E)XK nuclease family protein [Vicinamibacteria bacterium]